MQKLRKILSVLLTFTLVLGLSATSFASENQKVTVLQNNAKTCVVKEINTDGITIATNNKNTHLLTIEKYDSSGKNLISTNTLDLNSINKKVISDNKSLQRSFHWGNGDIYQHTICNREFDVWFGKPNEWKIRCKDTTRTVNETTKNSDALEKYRSDVEDVNDAEGVIMAAVGGTIALTAITAFLSGGTAAGIAAAGGGTLITTSFINLNTKCNNADYHFRRI